MAEIERLLELMATLRDPQRGCPWDLKQTYATIVPYTIEEAYEVADAIERNDFDDLREELGDLLLQVVFYAQIAREDGRFDFHDVAAAIGDKLVRRHPHVFADTSFANEMEQHAAWEAQKAEERAAKREATAPASVMDGVARALPALMRAEKLQKRAARVGFDWGALDPVIDKIHEEIDEVRAEVGIPGNHDRVREEVGDLLFAVTNLARHLKVDAEEALRHANDKFEARFRGIEARVAAEGRRTEECSLDELESHWDAVKKA
ncbi:MAG TPA: nucleoside triphosphate pyrophosphohydrolase [Thioalkalivibrio sp.]|nr:nucleoside triphosphate pyrophosphohydrolase [Thioalkalivibrio sp.]